MTRTVTAAALCVGLISTLAGCGMDEVQSPTGRVEPLVEVLTWWLAPGEAEAVQGLIQTHIARYPEARIFNTATASSLAMEDLLDQRLSHGDPPDLLQVTHRELRLIRDRYPTALENLDDLVDSLGLRQKMFPEAIAQVSETGPVLAMPINMHRENGLFYNKALFAAHHLAPPTTIAELMEACKRFKAAGVSPFATARQGWILRMMLNSLIAGSMGSSVYHDYFTSKSAVGLTQMREGIALFATILQNYVNPDAGEEGFGWTNAAQTLFNGDAAMFFHGDWTRGYFIQLGWRPGIDFGIVGSPGASDLFLEWGDSLAIPKGARNARGAREFLETAVSPAGQVAFNSVKGSTPIRGDVPKAALDPLGQSTLEDFERARYRMGSPNPGPLDAAVMKFTVDWDTDSLLQALVNSRFKQ
jgi:glucose/mannose transport system substrate-binding protein